MTGFHYAKESQGTFRTCCIKIKKQKEPMLLVALTVYIFASEGNPVHGSFAWRWVSELTHSVEPFQDA
ncbi:hypothetical protein A8F97_04445 [Pectobacterium parmentieri]|nr:hypothetical protein A8F97_04445 [Pectobacterium parmentieri]